MKRGGLFTPPEPVPVPLQILQKVHINDSLMPMTPRKNLRNGFLLCLPGADVCTPRVLAMTMLRIFQQTVKREGAGKNLKLAA